MKIPSNGPEDIGVVRENVTRVVGETSRVNAELTQELITAYDRESKLLGGISRREKEIARLRNELAKRDAKLATVSERLDRLLGSKAMQVQRAYWRLRRPGRSAMQRTGAQQ